ncbi:cyanophycinase [Chitinophagaceae bacterium LB-8]|uniref:Cyanophycinase n=1 Tax=Paraflavisolibacter caeni TaxID=2982496 RepID=A0A9X2XUF2_9BACT|nr:cyanophycinase [Paraflavisolibacter caeni]MCU7549090.1 cyanophycinase [Paraflavisolibacter caeni]
MQLPKGYLIAIGGAEDKGEEDKLRVKKLDFFEQGILRQIVELVGKKGIPKIELITTATSFPDEIAQIYKKAFKKLGIEQIGHLKLTSREDGDYKKNLERLEKSNCILFSGGDQLRLSSILGGTAFIEMVKEKYMDDHFVIAGTSAGAAAMSNTMICGGNADRAYMKGEVELNIGFGLIQSVIIDTHFDARGRFGRLVQAIAAQPAAIGIGLDEDTAVLIEKGTKLKAIGSSSVVVVDGSNVKRNNIADVHGGEPISISNLQVHVMARGDMFHLQSREFTAANHHLQESRTPT